MGHNVWSHINAVQEANADYANGQIPKMLIPTGQSDGATFGEIVDAIFSCDKREDAHAIIDHYDRFWMRIVGSRGLTGKKTKNPSGLFNNLFDVIESTEPPVEEQVKEEIEIITQSQFTSL